MYTNCSRTLEQERCMNVAHCVGPHVFDGDGWVHIHGGYESLHPLDQLGVWTSALQSPPPQTHLPKEPSAQSFSTAFESFKGIQILQKQHLLKDRATQPLCMAAVTPLWAKFPWAHRASLPSLSGNSFTRCRGPREIAASQIHQRGTVRIMVHFRTNHSILHLIT